MTEILNEFKILVKLLLLVALTCWLFYEFLKPIYEKYKQRPFSYFGRSNVEIVLENFPDEAFDYIIKGTLSNKEWENLLERWKNQMEFKNDPRF